MQELKVPKMINPDVLFESIESLVNTSNISYLDAIIHVCSVNELDIESVASMIKNNQRIKSSLQYEGEKLNFLPKTARLPL